MRHPSGPCRALLLGLLLAATVCGCTPWATYPSEKGSTNVGGPSLSPIPELMAEAIWYAHDRDGGTGEIVYNLPPGTMPVIYDKVESRLAAARPMTSADESAYHVTEVRVRTVDSEVDVIHPGPDGSPQKMTIAFRQNLLTGFRVERVRVWRYPVEAPPPSWEPPVEQEVATGEGA